MAKELAAEAKKRGNAAFGLKTSEGYEQALAAYSEAIEHNPDDHILHSNVSACHLELAKKEWIDGASHMAHRTIG